LKIQQAVILAGGMGTRMREESEVRPKPMILIGGVPIIDHLIRSLIRQGITDILILIGHKGDVIKDYFLNYGSRHAPTKVNLRTGEIQLLGDPLSNLNAEITLLDTGESSLTGDRVRLAAEYLQDNFLLTYGDGLSDIKLSEIIHSHSRSGLRNTVSITKNPSRFGVVTRDETGVVLDFSEKPEGQDLINMGYFILSKRDIPKIPSGTMLEKDFLQTLIRDKQLNSYMHEGFFLPIDSQRDVKIANNYLLHGDAPWTH
jgi:glucose-1-phosphate cytidylyltransferase